MGSLVYPGVDPQPVGDRWSLAGPRPMTQGRRPLVAELPATNGRGLVARPRRGRRPLVVDLGPAGDQRSPAGCGNTPG
jgi:hypothetical protein